MKRYERRWWEKLLARWFLVREVNYEEQRQQLLSQELRLEDHAKGLQAGLREADRLKPILEEMIGKLTRLEADPPTFADPQYRLFLTIDERMVHELENHQERLAEYVADYVRHEIRRLKFAGIIHETRRARENTLGTS